LLLSGDLNFLPEPEQRIALGRIMEIKKMLLALTLRLG